MVMNIMLGCMLALPLMAMDEASNPALNATATIIHIGPDEHDENVQYVFVNCSSSMNQLKEELMRLKVSIKDEGHEFFVVSSSGNLDLYHGQATKPQLFCLELN